ncbi:MAG: sensor histidine kinase, partial [Pseudomonas sp.]|nr:sensor histidine kinase [Pseudomonas sp.]
AGTRVELTVAVEGSQVKYQVRDHGPGIPAETLQHMTQRFWRNGNSNGCGLGLAIVQAIVERCRCELRFDSQPDGLRVELRMPLKRSA